MDITNDVIDDLEHLVNEIREKDIHNNIQNYTYNEKNQSIEMTSPNTINNEDNELEVHLIMSISPNREVEKVFTFNNNNNNANNNNKEEEEQENSRMSLMTPNTSFMMLPPPINISTVKSKSKKSSFNIIKSQNNTLMSVLSPLTVDNSFNHCHESHDLLTPETIRSEFEESKIIGYSAIKQLPMDLMDYSLDSDFGQGSDVEVSPVKPIKNSTMTKITHTTKATLLTGPTPVPFLKNFTGIMDIENINQNVIYK
jgi:hypothetical protein